MSRIALFALCATLIGVAGCSGRSGPQFDRSDVDNITKKIEELRIAFNAKDSPKAAALYSTTGVVMPPNRALMRGRQFVQQYYDDRFAEGASDLELDAADVSGQGTLAYASGDYRLNLVPKAGGPQRRDRGKFLWVFRETNGVWMIEYVIFSSDFVAPPLA
jgi:ketosteroid isomerase-like protein